MSKKSVYLFKVVISSTRTREEVPIGHYRDLFSQVLTNANANKALDLTYNQDPMYMDIIENTDEYLFARLGRKRLNNSMQKRDYDTGAITDVLAPDEIISTGIESFTYCILGYSHGILSLVNSKGAPRDDIFSKMFALYMNSYILDTESLPNNDCIRELRNGRAPVINQIHFDIAQPGPQIMQHLMGFNDDQVIEEVCRKTSSLVIDVKPEYRGKLIDDPTLIEKIIDAFRNSRNRYNTVKIRGKKDGRGSQKEYDLYETYFKYQIDVAETRQEGGRRVEVNKDTLQRAYRSAMMNNYDENKAVILAMSNRL